MTLEPMGSISMFGLKVPYHLQCHSLWREIGRHSTYLTHL